MFRRLLKWLASPTPPIRRSSARWRIRPTLEGLEGRLVPAPYTLTHLLDTPDVNLNDGVAQDAMGRTTLRAAIMQGNHDTGAVAINIPTALTGTITLGEPLPILGANFTITGPGSGSLTVARDPQAQGNFRIFRADLGTTCSIQGMTLTGGNAAGGPGGAIFNSGHLTLVDCMIHDNRAAAGGAIYNTGTLSASACSMWSNQATLDDGGAIHNEEGTVTLALGSLVYMNEAVRDGGGIYNAANSTLTIQNNSQIYFNGAGHQGGGIWNGGQLNMNGGILSANVVNETSGLMGSGRGGGYYGAGGSASFQGVNIEINRSTNRGGGFYLEAGTLGFNTCTISGNTSPTGPGGYIMLGATYNDPVACEIPDTIVREM